MEKLISRIMLLAGLIGACFGAYSFLEKHPLEAVSGLEEKIDRDLASVKEEKKEDIRQLRDEFRTQISASNSSISSQLGDIKKQLEKMDDRLYEMQRQQRDSAAIDVSPVEAEDI